MRSVFKYLPHLVILLALSIHATPASAQYYFGKNKVQYTKFNWHLITTDHFKIYFYTEERELAEIAAKSAEESYNYLAAKFGHEIKSRIPLIIYSNPNHFVQTNVTWSMLPENVAGFTEFIKGRVVVPFNGSYYNFDRVLRHELVHVFTLSRISRVYREYGRSHSVYPPLWFVEGLAECWSKDWDSGTDLIVRDMVINGNLPSIRDFWSLRGSYFMYKFGESLCHFMEKEYGRDILSRLFENWHVGRNFESILSYTLGDNFEVLSKKWRYYLMKRYYPQISNLDLPDINAERLTRRQFAVRPVPVMLRDKNGDEEQWVIYKANKSGYSAIYMMPANGDESRAVTLLKGDLSAKFESLHLTTSGIDQYDNRLLTFSSKSRERDLLYIYDLQRRKIISHYEFENLVAITSPRFSPDGKKVTFTGSPGSGHNDIYVVNLEDGEYQQLTDDIYNDLDPCFGYDGRSIVFSSDRGGEGYEGYLSLYRIWTDDRRLERLTHGRHHDRAPDERDDGAFILFSSDRGEESAFNIYQINAYKSMATPENTNRNLSQVTNYITGAFDPRFGSDCNEIYFSAYQNMGFHVFRTSLKKPEVVPDDEKMVIESTWLPGRINSESGTEASVKYSTDYSLDIAQSAVAYDGVYGSIGGFQAAISDVLGNNTIIFLVSNTARSKGEFLSSFNVGVTYLRRAGRINWGFGAYHLYDDEYFNDHDGYYSERMVGGVVHGSYPFSKFERFESSLFIRHSDKDIFNDFNHRKAVPVTQLFSFVADHTLWEPTGPLDGWRMNLTGGATYDLKSKRNFNRLASFDFRHYLRIRHLSCIASRFFAYTSAGLEPQRIYFGGSWSFRGYSRRQFYDPHILFNSVELRFPLINDFLIGFPIGEFRLRGIRGAFFHDAGTTWDRSWQGWKGSLGASIRVAIGYLVVLRFDISRRHDFNKISRETQTEFFFGWNF